jgi:hypothetical protein
MGWIGAYVWADAAGKWYSEIADKEVERFGAFGGSVLGAQSAKFWPEVYGFTLTGGDMHQGEQDTYMDLVAPIDGHYHAVLSGVSLENDNSGDCNYPPSYHICFANRSIISFLPSARQFPNIEVTETGTKWTDKGVIPANQKHHYVFEGDKYVEQ